jgi:hypothetical protein
MAYYKSAVGNYYILNSLIKYKKAYNFMFVIKIVWIKSHPIIINFKNEIDRDNCFSHIEKIFFNIVYIKVLTDDMIEELTKIYNGILEE